MQTRIVPQSRWTGRVAGALIGLTWLASALVASCSDDETNAPPSTCFELADGSCVEQTFVEPARLQPNADGVFELSLAATEVVLDGQRHCVRAYNGSYNAPILETPARTGEAPRSVRVDLANKLRAHDYRSLSGAACTCRDQDGRTCVPEHVHNRCVSNTGACTCVDEEGAECEHLFDFNVTNLHAHGSHVRPDYARGGESCAAETKDGIPYACRECGDDVCGDTSDDACFHGDNVLNAVHVNSGARYRWDIDEDGTHHTGLQWYHPHIHGTTAIQVASGAAGVWIVRGELDQLDGITNAKERVMVFSTPPIAEEGFAPLAADQDCSEETITFNDFVTLAATTSPQVNLINGTRRPRLVTPPGQVERWRILHAGFLDEVFLGLFRGADKDCSSFSTATPDTIVLTQIARDGLILPQPFEHPHLFLSPGYRVEAMLGGEGALKDGETWCLVASRFLQASDEATFGEFGEQPLSPPVAPSPTEILTRFETAGDVVAILNVASSAGAPSTTRLPDYQAVAALAPSMDLEGVSIEERCASAAAVADPADIDQVAVLQVGFFTADDPDPCDCENYNVNCQNFELTDRARYPFDRDLLLDRVEHWRVAASVDGHPFHIHINPFVVCPQDNVFDPLPFPHWRDTYLVNLKRKIDIVTQNRAFTGPYVFHCHKLTHEDHGMMELVRVCDPARDASCGDFGWRSCEADDLSCFQGLASTECSLTAATDPEAAACVALLGGPLGVCGPNACVSDADCAPGSCGPDHVCAPGP